MRSCRCWFTAAPGLQYRMKKKTGYDTEWLSFSLAISRFEWQGVAQAFQVLDRDIYLSVVIPAFNEAGETPKDPKKIS